jgi:GT2 family glycosyltransferase
VKDITIFCSISEKRISEVKKLLIPSILKQSFEGRILLYLTNYVGDNSPLLKDLHSFDRLKIEELQPSKSLGFGEAHNYAFNEVKPKENFIIANPDMYLHKECITNLLEAYDKKTGVLEARQLPYPHPKDPSRKSLFTTNWASGACSLINSEFFKDANGFDPFFWMYLEDVDLSWRAWLNNYKVLQNPRAVAYHLTGLYFHYSKNSYSREDFWSIRNFLYFSYKYFGEKGYKKALKLTLAETNYEQEFIEEANKNFLSKKKPSLRFSYNRKTYNRLNREGLLKIYGYNKFSQNPK